MYRESPLRIESGKTDKTIENKADIKENLNENKNRLMCQGQEEWFDINGAMLELGEIPLPEVSSIGSNDFVDNLFEQNILLREENVDQGVPLYDSNFQNWTSGNVSFIPFIVLFIICFSS